MSITTVHRFPQYYLWCPKSMLMGWQNRNRNTVVKGISMCCIVIFVQYMLQCIYQILGASFYDCRDKATFIMSGDYLSGTKNGGDVL